MSQSLFVRKLLAVWERGVEAYKSGERNPELMFEARDKDILASIGQTTQEFFDYAEDYVKYDGDPDFPDVLAVAHIRKEYFVNVQSEMRSSHTLDPDTLPAKTDSVRGIEWLPRIFEKAKAKIRGELHPDIMYGCGGDRRFLKEYHLTPAEFLTATLTYWDEPEKLYDWVETRSKR